MTDQQKKQKEIAVAFAEYRFVNYYQRFGPDQLYEFWLLTEEGKRLTAQEPKNEEINNEDIRSILENLDEIMAFLLHIEDRVGKEAFRHVYSCLEEAMQQAERKKPDDLLVKISGQLDWMEGNMKLTKE